MCVLVVWLLGLVVGLLWFPGLGVWEYYWYTFLTFWLGWCCGCVWLLGVFGWWFGILVFGVFDFACWDLTGF